MKLVSQLSWHILPASIIFLILLGLNLFAVTVFLAVGLIDNALDFKSVWEPILVGAVTVARPLIPSVILFLLCFTFDQLTKNKSTWLAGLLPIPFIMGVILLWNNNYPYLEIHSVGNETLDWLVREAVFSLGLIIICFAPYWYFLQGERFLIWLINHWIK